MMSQIVGAVAWDPQIRGVLSVALMVALLMGSVYVILATNLATRLGFLIALTGLFGWMTLMSGIWWVYAQGWQGDAPAWEVSEINTGDLTTSDLEQAHRLAGVQDQLPPADELNALDPADFEAVATGLEDELDGWDLLPESDGDRGEAQAAVDEALQGPDYPSFAAPEDYVVLYGLDYGGKPERQSDGVFDRVANQVTNTLRASHPPHYMAVIVQPGEPETEPVPGEPPPQIVPVEGADPVTVIMERDLGTTRLPAFMTMVVSGVLFGTFAYMLHVRDRTVEANRSAPLPEPVAAGKA